MRSFVIGARRVPVQAGLNRNVLSDKAFSGVLPRLTRFYADGKMMVMREAVSCPSLYENQICIL